MRFLILAVFLIGGISPFIFNTPMVSSTGLPEVQRPHSLVVDDPILPDVTAKAYGVFDIETGEILFSHNTDESLPIASVTKLFTAAAFEQSQVNETVVITNSDVATEGRAGKLESGQKYQLHELLFPLLLESSNDAAAVFERTLKVIPFADTTLADASGLSANNRATVLQLANEVRRVYLNVPQVFDVTRLKQYVGEYTGWVNNSPVRDLPGYRGGKHGYTEAANRTLAAVFAEPSLGERELGYIILGSNDLKADTLALRAAVEGSVHLE